MDEVTVAKKRGRKKKKKRKGLKVALDQPKAKHKKVKPVKLRLKIGGSGAQGAAKKEPGGTPPRAAIVKRNLTYHKLLVAILMTGKLLIYRPGLLSYHGTRIDMAMCACTSLAKRA